MRQTLIEIFGIPIHSFGFMIMLGFVLGIHVATRRARTIGIEEQHIYDLALAAMICGILGARTWYVCQYYERLDGWVDIFKIWEGGLVFHGGFFGGALGAIILMKRRHLPVLKTADALTPSLPIGLAFGRLGCYFNGCCWGGVCSDGFPLAVRYDPGTLPYMAHVERGSIASSALQSPPIHPSQIYASVLGLGVFFLLTWLYKRRRQHGEIFASFFVLYGIYRFTLEMFRDDTPQYEGLSLQLTSGQWTSLLFIGLGFVGWCILRRLGMVREEMWREAMGNSS